MGRFIPAVLAAFIAIGCHDSRNQGRRVVPAATATSSTPVITLLPKPIISVTDRWTVFRKSPDTRTIYVSNRGSDANDGLSEATAKATIDAGLALMRNGSPDWLLFEKGGIYPGEISITKSGRSTNEPLLIGSYGSGPRPRIESPLDADGINNYNGGVEHVAVTGLEITCPAYDGTQDPPAGIFLLGYFNDLLFEDLFIHNFGAAVVIQRQTADPVQFIRGIKLRRSVLSRAYKVGDTGHPQGIYSEGVDGFLVEDCTFYRCGFDPDVPGSNPTIFRHAAYFQNNTRNVTARGNITIETSSHGYQFRGSRTVCVNNFIMRAAICVLIGGGDDPDLTPDGGASCVVAGNVFMNARNIGSDPRGFGFSVSNLLFGIVRGNVLAHTNLAHDWAHPFWYGRGSRPGNIGINNLLIEDNIIYNWRGHFLSSDSSSATGTYTNTVFRDNELQSLLPQSGAPWTLAIDASHAPAWTSYLNRFYDVNAPQFAFRIGGTLLDLEGWKAQLGDPNSVVEQIDYPDPDRTPQRYMDFVEGLPDGTSTVDDFVGKLLEQSRDSWDRRYTAESLNAWIRGGFGR